MTGLGRRDGWSRVGRGRRRRPRRGLYGLVAVAAAVSLVQAPAGAAVASAQGTVVAARWKLNEATAAVRAPKAYWKLDEQPGQDRAEDVEGAFPAGIHGGAGFGTAGKIDSAVHLPGSTGYAATSGPVVDTTRSFSVSAWARLTARTATAAVAGQEGSVGSVFQLYYSRRLDRWVFGMQSPDSDDPVRVRARSAGPPTLNAWTHLTGVYDADAEQIRLYVDGEAQQTVDQPNVWDGTGPFDLGRLESKGSHTGYFAGDLDDVRVFDQPVTAPEAALLAGASTPETTTPDDSGFGHHATLFGNAYIDQGNAWVGTGAVALDGDGDYAATHGPVVETDQSFTVAGWVQTAARPTHNAAIFSQEGDVNSAFTLRYAPDPDDPANAGGYQIDLPDRDAVGATHQTADHSYFQSNGSWDHVAIVYDAAAHQVRLYVNGQLDQASRSYLDNVTAFSAAKAFQIGRTKTDGAYGEYWPGAIDDVWAINGVATDDQIRFLANGAEIATGDF